MSQEQGLIPTQQWLAPRTTPHFTALDLLRQDTLGEYEILAELGRGGMATVYLAHDIALDRKVAIKVMSTATLDEGMAERFRREARTAAALNHPHIIPVYAVRERSGLLYFVMKFIPGQSLDPIIKAGGRVSIPMAHVVLAQAAAALGYAHRRGVIHRDVKPANIMLDDEGWVVMTDFGIAKVATATGLTMTGVTVGTPAYMSPEQCAGKEVTGASDQYSLGVLAYELITGQKPFAATTAMAMMYAHFNETALPLRQLRPDCPAELEERVLRMLAKAPEDRWPSIEEVFGAPVLGHDDPTRRELVALALSSPVATMVSRLSTPTSPIPPARRSVAAASATAPIPQGLVPTATGYQDASPAAPSGTFESSGPSRAQLPAGTGFNRWGLVGIVAALAVLVGSYFLTRDRRSAAQPSAADSALVPAPETPVVSSPTVRDTTSPLTTAAPVAPPQPQPSPPVSDAVGGLSLSPPRIDLTVGQRSRLSARLSRPDGSALRTPVATQWRSLAPRIASVARDGEVYGLAPGRALITAFAGGKGDTVVVDVTAAVAVPVAVASLTVAPDSVSLAVGGSIALAATPRDAAGLALPGREVTWSSNSRLAVVSGSGQVQGVSPGTAVVTATAQGRSAQVTVVVMPVAVASVVLTGSTAPLKPGETVALSATARDAQGEPLPDRRISWESSDPGVAAVSNGQVTARAVGTATITASVERRSATARITVAVPVDPVAERARATAGIAAVLKTFAGGLNNRDVAQLRQAYPTLPASEEGRWQAMLTAKSMRSIQAGFDAIEPPRIEQNSATQRVRLRLQLVYSGMPAENSVANYTARFEQAGGSWKMTQLSPE